MNDKLILDPKTVAEFKGFPAKIEQLRVFIDIIKEVTLNEAGIPEDELNEKVICLVDTFTMLVTVRNKELLNTIKKITPSAPKDINHNSLKRKD